MMHMSYHNDRYDALEELFRYCEEHGIDAEVNGKDNNGDTALRMAMYKGNLRTVKLLLEKGARVLDYGDDDNITMLMMPFSDTTRHMGLRPAKSGAKQDANASACLTAVLDAVLLRGRVGDTVAKL
jgi:ankyrin repeat protein